MRSEPEKRVAALTERDLERMGLELVDVEIRREAGTLVVRLFIDRPGGVDLDTCSRASEVTGLILDNEQAIEGPYNLEVSSPGIERALTKPEHYQRHVGSEVRVKTAAPVEGRKSFTGTLREADGEGFVIESDGRSYRIAYEAVVTTRLKVDEIGLKEGLKGERAK